ncbi:unnamed protein product [Soboliphyme baturini]|uniref:DEK_C domain-containing protein n=1 Tax=Soboliphyme baturini TaxID=241478 RepID=A0A183IXA8_9BILA|nr:unnamed protein product [Soboliphyme baturini]
MDDQMNRQLTADINDNDTPEALANELVDYGFINKDDREEIVNLIAHALLKYKLKRQGLSCLGSESSSLNDIGNVNSQSSLPSMPAC